MPTRILREGIISSERVNSLSERAELFYRKLMSVVDDYGRFYSNPISILGACYPMRPNVCEADVKQMLSECISAGLIVVYGGGKYIVMLDFRQQTRSKSKFPEPTENELLIKCKSNDNQMCRAVVGGDVVEGECESGAARAPADAHLPTWDEVKTFAEMSAIKPESAKSFYDHHEGHQLWLNQHGKLINWKHKLTTWAAKDRTKPPEAAKTDPFKMTKEQMLAEAIR